jgi:16S rRNA (guanine527-N7)-methyltransferase
MSVFERALKDGAEAVDLSLTAQEIEQASAHFKAVLRWNKVHNLTRVVDPAAAARRHYLDGFVGFMLLEGALASEARTSVVDVGSGAGYPGIIGAIRWPSSRFTLLDAAAKRCSFLELVASELGLSNVAVRHADARQERDRWPLVISRATLSSGQLDAALRLRAAGGRAALWVGDADVGALTTVDEVLTLGPTKLLLR